MRENGENFLNQLKKPTQKPTIRWVFFCFLGLHMIFIEHKKLQITNLKERHRIILRCLGPPYQKYIILKCDEKSQINMSKKFNIKNAFKTSLVA
ncbi:hypothetical protein NEOC65_002437 [Neochlamydia sp. AcF65]|nr:hypothetical protein [Neochlamydia sp. AcF65]